MSRNLLIAIMGLPGSGKSTMAKMVADAKGYAFFDIDDAMPASFKEKMKNNELVTEKERMAFQHQWMQKLDDLLKDQSVVAALVLPKESQREMLIETFPDLILIHLQAPLDVLKERLRNRTDHFFNEQTLEKAFAVSEPVGVKHIKIDTSKDVETVFQDVLNAL